MDLVSEFARRVVRVLVGVGRKSRVWARPVERRAWAVSRV